jgi:hypothetical protein
MPATQTGGLAAAGPAQHAESAPPPPPLRAVQIAVHGHVLQGVAGR